MKKLNPKNINSPRQRMPQSKRYKHTPHVADSPDIQAIFISAQTPGIASSAIIHILHHTEKHDKYHATALFQDQLFKASIINSIIHNINTLLNIYILLKTQIIDQDAILLILNKIKDIKKIECSIQQETFLKIIKELRIFLENERENMWLLKKIFYVFISFIMKFMVIEKTVKIYVSDFLVFLSDTFRAEAFREIFTLFRSVDDFRHQKMTFNELVILKMFYCVVEDGVFEEIYVCLNHLCMYSNNEKESNTKKNRIGNVNSELSAVSQGVIGKKKYNNDLNSESRIIGQGANLEKNNKEIVNIKNDALYLLLDSCSQNYSKPPARTFLISVIYFLINESHGNPGDYLIFFGIVLLNFTHEDYEGENMIFGLLNTTKRGFVRLVLIYLITHVKNNGNGKYSALRAISQFKGYRNGCNINDIQHNKRDDYNDNIEDNKRDDSECFNNQVVICNKMGEGQNKSSKKKDGKNKSNKSEDTILTQDEHTYLINLLVGILKESTIKIKETIIDILDNFCYTKLHTLMQNFINYEGILLRRKIFNKMIKYLYCEEKIKDFVMMYYSLLNDGEMRSYVVENFSIECVYRIGGGIQIMVNYENCTNELPVSGKNKENIKGNDKNDKNDGNNSNNEDVIHYKNVETDKNTVFNNITGSINSNKDLFTHISEEKLFYLEKIFIKTLTKYFYLQPDKSIIKYIKLHPSQLISPNPDFLATKFLKFYAKYNTEELVDTQHDILTILISNIQKTVVPAVNDMLSVFIYLERHGLLNKSTKSKLLNICKKNMCIENYTRKCGILIMRIESETMHETICRTILDTGGQNSIMVLGALGSKIFTDNISDNKHDDIDDVNICDTDMYVERGIIYYLGVYNNKIREFEGKIREMIMYFSNKQNDINKQRYAISCDNRKYTMIPEIGKLQKMRRIKKVSDADTQSENKSISDEVLFVKRDHTVDEDSSDNSLIKFHSDKTSIEFSPKEEICFIDLLKLFTRMLKIDTDSSTIFFSLISSFQIHILSFIKNMNSLISHQVFKLVLLATNKGAILPQISIPHLTYYIALKYNSYIKGIIMLYQNIIVDSLDKSITSICEHIKLTGLEIKYSNLCLVLIHRYLKGEKIRSRFFCNIINIVEHGDPLVAYYILKNISHMSLTKKESKYVLDLLENVIGDLELCLSKENLKETVKMHMCLVCKAAIKNRREFVVEYVGLLYRERYGKEDRRCVRELRKKIVQIK